LIGVLLQLVAPDQLQDRARMCYEIRHNLIKEVDSTCEIQIRLGNFALANTAYTQVQIDSRILLSYAPLLLQIMKKIGIIQEERSFCVIGHSTHLNQLTNPEIYGDYDGEELHLWNTGDHLGVVEDHFEPIHNMPTDWKESYREVYEKYSFEPPSKRLASTFSETLVGSNGDFYPKRRKGPSSKDKIGDPFILER
jgi:hypothetical protein